MKRLLPLVTLWASLAFLVAVNVGTGKLVFDQVRAFNQGAAQASGPLEFISPSWLIQQTDLLLVRLWWMFLASGVGIAFIAMSTVWVSLSRGRSVS
jgi:hypothetical protein